MSNIGTIGYTGSALAYLIFSVILLTSWKGKSQGGWLLVATIISVAWAGLAAYYAGFDIDNSRLVAFFELLRNGAWFAFLFVLIPMQFKRHQLPWRPIKFSLALGYIILVIIGLLLVYEVSTGTDASKGVLFETRLFFSVVIAIIGLILVEQLFRNATAQQRWSLKFLCLGIGGLFTFDFYLYANALLVKEIDHEIWAARGFINVIVVPLIAVSAARNPQWSLDVFVSREFVFYTSTLMGAGIFLIAMAAGGYYIRLYGGTWGGVAQLIFLFGAAMVLAMLLFSGQARAQLRVFLNKHFFNYRYDYREEWLRFINTLSGQSLHEHLRERVILAVAEIVESPGGMLWQKQENNQYQLMVTLNISFDNYEINTADNSSLINFLQTKQWVVNLDDYRRDASEYDNIELPQWLANNPQLWLIVPLLQESDLLGFIVLAKGRAKMTINWEDRDLLKTTGRQAANYLALLDANEALIDARQFEAFNRLSAYVVHDLKNVSAQLALVVKNAEKHRNNPEFMDDALNTVENAVSKMTRMLSQLRKGRTGFEANEEKTVSRISLNQVIETAIAHRQADNPRPHLEFAEPNLYIQANEDRMLSVMEHLIQNAQEATDNDGFVKLFLISRGEYAIVSIEDNGSGMDAEFIKSRLFKPFDTTKGNAGMGIGVYESREFVLSLGGRMNVTSDVNKGTKFELYLKLDDQIHADVQQNQ